MSLWSPLVLPHVFSFHNNWQFTNVLSLLIFLPCLPLFLIPFVLSCPEMSRFCRREFGGEIAVLCSVELTARDPRSNIFVANLAGNPEQASAANKVGSL